jgi:hypothetical protein
MQIAVETTHQIRAYGRATARPFAAWAAPVRRLSAAPSWCEEDPSEAVHVRIG